MNSSSLVRMGEEVVPQQNESAFFFVSKDFAVEILLATKSQFTYCFGTVKGLPPSHCTPDGCQQPLICPLSRAPVGAAVRIKQLAAPPDVTHRLREIGFCEEQRIRLLSRHSTVICQVCNARLGLSRQLAETILVEALPQQQNVA